MNYLYSYEIHGNGVHRYEITRETISNIWIKISEDYEEMISKKTYKTGSGWDARHYYIETPELIEKYLKTKLKRDYLKKLDILLQNCEDEKIMNQIIGIKL